MTSEARRAAGLYVDDSWRTVGSSDRFSDAEAANELRMLDECAAPPQAPPLTLPPHSPLSLALVQAPKRSLESDHPSR